ncbi:lyase [Ornithobacterium rhinotracheale]|uniref:chondroitinase family polysaccharide lyase n=1 Tax=Ornithobacterium rhinotracheale TaxID=28251 RepID=UPI00129CC21C|nr:chondroitinase family polysaccharide lyase [Ornithobacterium rhinotracheale]MRJ10796.1 lyase [Ornithobacterium rhinotracheale]
MKKLIIWFQTLMCLPLLAQKNPTNLPANSDGLVLKAEKSMVKLVENPSKTISQSAEWDWSKNADFKLFNSASTKVENPRATLVFWLYNTTPQNEKLMVKVSQDASNYFIFPFGLNFKGWRTAWVMFHRDMQVVGNPKKINFIEFLKPKNAKNGIFYLNDVRLVNEVNPRSPMQDEQLPFVNKGVEKSANAHWVALYNFAHQPKKLAETKSVSTSQQNGITTIAKRLKKQILDDFDVEKNKVSFAEVQKEFNDWGIQEKNGVYSGKPVLSMNDREILKKEQLPEKHIKDFTELMLKIAILRDFSQNLTEQKSLDNMFLTLLNFMHDQGWAAGSGMGALHHLGYNFEGFYESCFLMRDVIKAAGLTQQTYDDMFWFSGLGRIYTPKKDLPHSNIDVFNTLLRGMLCTILTDDNKGKIAQELKQFSWWLSENMMPTYSIRGTFKPDGAVVHHGTLYPAYGVGGFRGLSETVYALSKTDFQVSTAAYNSFKKVLLTAHAYANPRHWPLSVSGRHPTGNFKLSPKPFLWTALSSPTADEDAELASAYMLILNKNKDKWSQYFKTKNIQAKYPTGHWNINYGLLDLHRRKDWLVALRGHNRYFVSHESYPGQNVFGRFLTYGNLQVLYDENNKNAPKNNFEDKGWDWSLIPGTTTLHLPIDAMRANIINADNYSGVEEMLLTDEVFAGGTNLNGQGVYAMQLHGHDKYDMGSFRANKSWFMFDDLVVCLGSDIENNRSDVETRTTVFQNYLGEKTIENKNPLLLNGELLSPKKMPRFIKYMRVLDSRKIGYVFPKVGQIELYRGLQKSRDQKDKKDTHGVFETLTFNHKKSPKNQKYEYAMLIDSDDKALADVQNRIKNGLLYEVLQQDSIAHIVDYRPLNMCGLAIFKANEKLFNLLVESVDKPSLILYEKKGNDYQFAITNPDLGFFQGKDDTPIINGKRKEVSIYSRQWYGTPATPSVVKVVLNGLFEILPNDAIKSVRRENRKTIIEVKCAYGIATKMNITPILM